MQIAECNEPIARNIQRIIDSKGLKQVAVAARANFTPNAFSAMLRGRRLIKQYGHLTKKLYLKRL